MYLNTAYKVGEKSNHCRQCRRQKEIKPSQLLKQVLQNSSITSSRNLQVPGNILRTVNWVVVDVLATCRLLWNTQICPRSWVLYPARCYKLKYSLLFDSLGQSRRSLAKSDLLTSSDCRAAASSRIASSPRERTILNSFLVLSLSVLSVCGEKKSNVSFDQHTNTVL